VEPSAPDDSVHYLSAALLIVFVEIVLIELPVVAESLAAGPSGPVHCLSAALLIVVVAEIALLSP